MERYKEQIRTAFHQVLRFAFGLPNSIDALDNLQKVLDDTPPSVADALSVDVEGLSRTILELKETSGQTSLFPENEEEAMKSEAKKSLPHLISMIPREHLMPNHKLVNELTRDLVGAGETHIRVSPKNAKQPSHITCNLAYDTEKIQLSCCRPLSEYDRNVYDAVTSLYVGGDPSHIMTPAMVYRAMTGMSDTEDPSPQQIKAVTDSLNRLSCIRAEVDCTMELKARRIALNLEGYVRSGWIGTYLLNTTSIRVEAGGKEYRAYKIEKAPILYAYSKALNQVLSVPSHMLDIKAVESAGLIAANDRISNTEGRIAIKGYLLRRIEGMKNPKNKLLSRSISLQSYEKDGRHHAGLYEIAGKVEPSKTEAARIRGYVDSALSFWESGGYIKGYTWKKSGRKIIGIEIQI